MKKLSFTLFAALFAIALNAQVSVWDGSTEPWDTSHAGTENDPILIENAAQLAYLAMKTNELHYSNYEYHNMYIDTCFLLTVDLDLGGENGLEWVPIAQDGISLQTRCFAGYFNGGNHTISNMNLKDGSGRIYMGLFGHVVEGSVKNIMIDGNSINLPDFHLSGFPGGLGTVIGYGENMVVEHCKNNVNLICEYAYFEGGGSFGGLFGQMDNSAITDCHNYGNIEIQAVNSSANFGELSFGGIGGTLYDCEIDVCSNNGNISAQNDNNNYAPYVSCGGIAGRMSGSITNCYNTGNLDLEVHIVQQPSGSIAATGGLVGKTMPVDILNLSSTNCYSASDMSITGMATPVFISGLIGYNSDDVQVAASNCYYLNTIESINDYGTPLSESFMKSQDFVGLLNAGGTVYAMDDLGHNHGYPVFAQYYSVDENEIAKPVSVYPNPGSSQLNVCTGLQDANVIVYDMNGRLIHNQEVTGGMTSLDTSTWSSGVYLWRVASNGKEVVSGKWLKW